MKRTETNRPHNAQRPVEEGAPDANTGSKIWLTIACAFALLCVLVWLNEILDLPHFLLGAPRTPINWREAVGETVVLVVSGLFAVSILVRNITKRKQAEEALRKSEQKYSSLINDAIGSLESGVIILDENFKVVWINTAMEQFFGVNKRDLIGIGKRKTIREKIKYIFKNPEQFEKTVLATYDNNTYVESFECHVLPAKDREGRYLIHWSTPIKTGAYAGGRIEHYYDITKRKRLEEQLRHAHKMAAIGTLAGGMAHNFNNILAGIMGYASLLKKNLGKESPQIADLESIERLSLRAADLTKALTAFSCKGKYYPRLLSVNRLLESVLEIIRQTAGKDIEIKTELSQEVAEILGDDGQLYKTIMNLCINACEAMPEGGTLAVKTAEAKPEERFFVVHPGLRKGRYVSISVSDTGCGMDSETTEHIFEPFFTTRGLAEKPGLGLSMVSSVVEGHGGCIDVESAPWKGSTFTIYLPAAREKKREATPEPVATLKGNETIMIVDNDKDFRNSTRRWLKELGYTALVTQSGEEALNLLEENKDDIDIVLLNMLMEGLSGEETFRKMRDMVPGLAVIICTGYFIDNGAGQLLAEGARDFIQKPFEHDSLARKIRQVMDNH